MNKPTLEDIKKAYQEQGLKPRRFATLNVDCACPLGVLYAKATNNLFASYNEIEKWATSQWGGGFCLGIVYGFDSGGYGSESRFEDSSEAFREGYKLGKEAAKELLVDE